jgi:tellurite resistance protein TerC
VPTTLLLWLTFAAITILLLAAGLVGTRRTQSPPTFRAAARSTLIVVAAAGAFAALLWVERGRATALQFVTGYVVELSLSVDNLLVFILLLRYFAVPRTAHATVLRWGIVGAVALRGAMILAGSLLLDRLHWLLYLLGALLVVTGFRLLRGDGNPAVAPERNPMLRLARHLMPVSQHFAGNQLTVREGGRRLITPLVLVIVAIEWTDLVFATDSVPAVFAITRDPLIVLTSNILAVAGLRALFFVVEGMLTRFALLRYGVAVVLLLVGLKMLLGKWMVVPPGWSLLVIVAVLGASIAGSWARRATGDG